MKASQRRGRVAGLAGVPAGLLDRSIELLHGRLVGALLPPLAAEVAPIDAGPNPPMAPLPSFERERP
jgi:hypothetical protein